VETVFLQQWLKFIDIDNDGTLTFMRQELTPEYDTIRYESLAWTEKKLNVFTVQLHLAHLAKRKKYKKKKLKQS